MGECEVYCGNCGREFAPGDRFCFTCGSPLPWANDTVVEQGGRNKKILVGVIIALVGLVIVATILLMHLIPKNVSFKIGYNEESIEEFLEDICENVEGDYAKVIDPNYDSPAGNSCYAAQMEIKLKNKVEENVQMRFYNGGSSDMVQYGRVFFYDSDSKNEFACRKAFVVALEKTLCGKSYIDEYVKSFNSISKIAAENTYDDSVEIAEYWLNDNLKVEIQCDTGYWWTLEYKIINVP